MSQTRSTNPKYESLRNEALKQRSTARKFALFSGVFAILAVGGLDWVQSLQIFPLNIAFVILAAWSTAVCVGWTRLYRRTKEMIEELDSWTTT